jgi:hypothetical protein
VAQGTDSEFKPQYRKKNKKQNKTSNDVSLKLTVCTFQNYKKVVFERMCMKPSCLLWDGRYVCTHKNKLNMVTVIQLKNKTN